MSPPKAMHPCAAMPTKSKALSANYRPSACGVEFDDLSRQHSNCRGDPRCEAGSQEMGRRRPTCESRQFLYC
jgi:hypothetical protein